MTVANFVAKIKAMDNRERQKLQVKRLIELICAVPDNDNLSVAAQLAEMRTSIEKINKSSAITNNEIVALKAQNDELVRKNAAMNLEIDLLKIHAKE